MVLKLIQTCLEASDTGKLIFVSPPTLFAYPNLRSGRGYWRSSKAHVLRLPDELLQPCLQAVADLDIKLSEDHDYYDQYYYNEADSASSAAEDDCKESHHDLLEAKPKVYIRYESTYALILTCKRFHSIALPMLYARPHFDAWHYERPRLSQCQKFYDTIKRNPPLRLFVQHLTLARWTFNDDFVQTCLRFPHLKSLKLSRSMDEGEGDRGGGPEPGEEGTLGLNEIQFRHLRARPQEVKSFLKWPRQLHVFAMDDMTYDGYDWDYTEANPKYRWNYAILTDVLSPQRLNLQVLQLGWMGYTCDQNQFDVSIFPNLHTWQLCVAYEKPDAVACGNWLTRNLRTIILDIGKNDSQGGKRSDFNQNKGQTVIDFAGLASQTKEQRPDSIGLQEIGFVAHSIGDDSWVGNEEWLCDHEGWYAKTNILKALKAIEAHGFSAFWIGASGARHTVKMLETACNLCAAAS